MLKLFMLQSSRFVKIVYCNNDDNDVETDTGEVTGTGPNSSD